MTSSHRPVPARRHGPTTSLTRTSRFGPRWIARLLGIQGKFRDQPLVEASIRETIGGTYEDLGLYPEAQAQLERALELRRRVLGDDHADTLIVMSSLGSLDTATKEGRAGRTPSGECIDIARRERGEDDATTLQILNNLALTYKNEGKYAQAEPLYKNVLEIRRRVLGEEHDDTLVSMNNLAMLYRFRVSTRRPSRCRPK